jgi:hypothetical protein
MYVVCHWQESTRSKGKSQSEQRETPQQMRSWAVLELRGLIKNGQDEKK